jgi:membrane protein
MPSIRRWRDAVLGLLALLALQATVIVYAIEADVVRVKHLWPRSIVQPLLTRADKEYYTDALRAEAQRPEQQVDIAYEESSAAATSDAGDACR